MRFSTLAPAKVNLVLRVGARRDDGFHDVSSLMVPLDLADRVAVRVSPKPGPVTCAVPGRSDLDGTGNLAARAAALVRERAGREDGVSIRIAKRIPVTAGLGGGSSDAAAVIRVLARAFRISDARMLRDVGAEVGSDVPFFLGTGPAWAGGRGERIVPAAVPELHLVLVFPTDPALAIRAGEAYGWLDEARAGRAPALPRRPAVYRTGLIFNDLEAACLAHRPALAPLLERLVGQGATKAIMSGSGPTSFGVFPSRSLASKAARAVSVQGVGPKVQVIVARTVQRQPRVTPWKSPRSASSP